MFLITGISKLFCLCANAEGVVAGMQSTKVVSLVYQASYPGRPPFPDILPKKIALPRYKGSKAMASGTRYDILGFLFT